MRAMDQQEARAYVEALYEKVAQRWQERVTEGEFMQEFAAGRLPREVFALFFRNWGAYTIEINTLTACSYQRFLPFFKQHPDLMAALGDAIADEFIHPAPPGHTLIMLQTAAASGSAARRSASGRCWPSFGASSTSPARCSTRGRRRSGSPSSVARRCSGTGPGSATRS